MGIYVLTGLCYHIAAIIIKFEFKSIYLYNKKVWLLPHSFNKH